MIKISVVSYNNEFPSQPLSAVFGPVAALIGRGNDNFLVLQDPKRYVSRLQASIKSEGQRHTIVNLSQANPILVNGEEIALGQEVDLRIGDEIQIGLYLLRAESPTTGEAGLDNGASIAPARLDVPSAPQAGVSHNVASEAMPLDLSKMSGSGNDPFADLLGSAVSSSSIPSSNASPAKAPLAPMQSGSDAPLGFDDILGISSSPANGSSQRESQLTAKPANHHAVFGFDDLLSGPSHGPLPPEHNAAIIPDDFDPFALPSVPRNTNDPLATITHDDVSLESLAGHNSALEKLMSAAGNSSRETSLLDPNSLGLTLSSTTDPLALFASEETLLPAKQDHIFAGDVASNHASELNAHFAMPQTAPRLPTKPEIVKPPVSAPSSIPGIPQPMPDGAALRGAQSSSPILASGIRTGNQTPAHATSEKIASASNENLVDTVALTQAFLRGANLPPDTISSGVTIEWMEMMGRFVATATQGAVELIASRAMVKREVKADLTMVVVRKNNPLKFLPDGQSALIQMLGKKIPGFMEPIEAMQDAYLDLRGHQIGVVAGMRAALDDVLKRFDPELLEKKLKARTFMDSLMSTTRKAKMWDLHSELFKDIYSEAQDDFQTLFGKAFLTAYEQEIARFLKETQHD